MGLYLYRRLCAESPIPTEKLLAALASSARRRSAFIESIVVEDLEFARYVVECFQSDGEEADPAWRPDPRLLLDLPPGICERFLAFPFRERAGAIEVATVSPLDVQVREEFSRHISRPVALFRGNLRGLLAAAGAPIDYVMLTQSLSEPPPGMSSSPFPLVRKSERKSPLRERMRTAPGIGEDASSSIPPSFPQGQDTAPPSSAAERMRQARDARELALSLGLLIFGPSVIFEIAGGLLHLRAMSPHEDCDESPIDLEESCCLTSAVAASRYMGPWYPSEIHDRYNHVFNQGELVRVDRIGTKESGLVVARKVTFDDRDDSKLLSRASRVWDQLSERNTLYG